MATKRVAPKPTYDGSNAKKDGIGIFVKCVDGSQYLFGPNAQWRWKKIAGMMSLEVEHNGQIALHIPRDNVYAVGGPQVLFRDAEWK